MRILLVSLLGAATAFAGTDNLRALLLGCERSGSRPFSFGTHTGTTLLGKQSLEPSSRAFQQIKLLINGLRSPSDFAAVPPADVKVSETRRMGGLGNQEMRVGTLPDGRKVMVKVSNPAQRTEAQVLNEARWYLTLNKLGLGPEFHGLMRLETGELCVVTEYVEGQTFPPGRRDRPSFTPEVADRAARQILQAGVLLRQAGIHYAPDMQFRITPEGNAVLIDPEYFAEQRPVNPLTNLPYDPVENTRQIANDLRAYRRNAPADQPRSEGGLIIPER